MTRVKSLATKLSQCKSKWPSKMLLLAFAMVWAMPLSVPALLTQSALALPATDENIDSQGSPGTAGADAGATQDKVAPGQTVSLKTSVQKPLKETNFISPFDVLDLPTAVQFTVVFDTPIDSRTARQGNPIECHLKDDLVFESRLIAPAGSVVLGHINHFVKSRTMSQAMVSKDERFHKTSIVKVAFDEIITPEQDHIKIQGMLSKQKATFGDKVEREVVVGKKGIVESAEPTLSDDTMIGAQVVNFVVGTGLSQLGTVATFGVLPLVMGAIGATNPSIITMKAVAKEDTHPRLRGLTLGVVEALPGGPVVQSFIYRGSELNIKVGDELLVQAHSPYNDQATTTEVSAKLAVPGTADGKTAGRHYYPVYQPKFTPKTGNKVLGTHADGEDRFGLWQ